jgi:hypothetical protein
VAQKSYSYTLQFLAGDVNPSSGVLEGVTVAEIGLATGHFAFLDQESKVVGVGGLDDMANFPSAVKYLPLAMDADSLKTVAVAGKMAGKVKAREDHDDSVGARAGYVDNFRVEGNKVVCDQHIFNAYRNRATFLETAQKTPELIGLSGDFKFNLEVRADCCLMRVTRVDAVDIVDKGALTHAGLFKAKISDPEVDNPDNTKPEPFTIMAKTIEPPDLKAFKTMCDAVAAYRAQNAESCAAIDEAMAAITPVRVPTPADAPAPVPPGPDQNPNAKLAALKTELETSFATQLTALKTENAAAVQAAVTAALGSWKQEFAALGIKPAAVPALPAAPAPEPAKIDPKEKDYRTLCKERAAEQKIKMSEANNQIAQEFPDIYRASLIARGIVKAA